MDNFIQRMDGYRHQEPYRTVHTPARYNQARDDHIKWLKLRILQTRKIDQITTMRSVRRGWPYKDHRYSWISMVWFLREQDLF